MAGSRFPQIESGIDALRQDLFAAFADHANETSGKIKAAIASVEKELNALLENIEEEAMSIKRDIKELRADVDKLKA